MAEKPYVVHAEWDEQAGVWIATSDDVPGLCCEGATVEGLVDTVVALVSDLLIANQPPSARARSPCRIGAKS